MEPATLSPLIKRLEAQGRVSRARRADDERVLDIDAHRRTAARCGARRSSVPRQIMERVGMDAAEVGRLREALVRFAGRAPSPSADVRTERSDGIGSVADG